MSLRSARNRVFAACTWISESGTCVRRAGNWSELECKWGKGDYRNSTRYSCPRGIASNEKRSLCSSIGQSQCHIRPPRATSQIPQRIKHARICQVDGPLPEYDQRLNVSTRLIQLPFIHQSLPVAGNHSYNCSRNFKFLFRLEIPTAVVAIFSM